MRAALEEGMGARIREEIGDDLGTEKSQQLSVERQIVEGGKGRRNWKPRSHAVA
jgi:hypothetical protein